MMMMVSKGVDYYFVNSSTFQLSASAQNTDDSYAMGPINVEQPPLMTKGNCQITWEFPYIPPSGSFTFSTNTSPAKSFTESINAVTGNTSGPLENMMNTPSVTEPTFALSYGMFDAGTGSGTGLTNQDQIYAYLTPSQQTWMGNLAAADASVNNAPFGCFVLPGAHDAGTWDLTQVNTLCSTAQGIAALGAAVLLWLAILIPVLGPLAPLILGLAAVKLEDVVIGLAVTQKDNTTTMLNLGCRYFDFRPGKAPSGMDIICPDIYHIHTAIPGQELSAFFTDVLTWLVANPTEIVAISLGTSGFADHGTMDPTVADLQAKFLKAQQAVTGASSLQIGTTTDLQTSYATLVSDHKRLFFLNQGFQWYPATKYDSYSDSAYATTDPATIMTQLNTMKAEGQADSDYTVLQFQATATNQNIAGNIEALVASASDAYEPLMSTKALMDSNTYPWALAYVPQNLSNSKLLVLLNDFVDNALSGCVASTLTKQRCQANASGH
ncbi:MAG: hypothetical protein ACKO37_07460 [Vampirovibrionales bacterium]